MMTILFFYDILIKERGSAPTQKEVEAGFASCNGRVVGAVPLLKWRLRDE